MGPRLFSRGKSRRPLSGKEAQTLQWGRDCSAAESLDIERWGAIGLLASMGPRLFSRGKLRARRDRSRWAVASMGPRLFSRGKSR